MLLWTAVAFVLVGACLADDEIPEESQSIRAKRSPDMMGKRISSMVRDMGKRPKDLYSFGIGKRSISAEDMADYMAEEESQAKHKTDSGAKSPNSAFLVGDKRDPYSFGLGKRSSEEDSELLEDLRDFPYHSVSLGKRAPDAYAFGMGKRAPDAYAFGMGKRAPDAYAFGMGKRDPYAFGLGKRDPYAFGLGKRDPYAFGLGKRDPYAFGLGKRDPYAFGLGKRALKRDPYAFGLGKRDPYSFGLGKREPYGFGLGR